MGLRWARLVTAQAAGGDRGVIGVLGVVAHARARPAPRPARRQHQARGHDRAQVLRPAVRGVRPGLHRPADGRHRLRERPSRPRSDRRASRRGPPRRSRASPAPPRRSSTRPATSRSSSSRPRAAPPRRRRRISSPTMRDEAGEIRRQYGVNGLVTGTTAINIDTSDKLTAALPGVPGPGRRPRAAAADARVPLDPRPDQGGRRVPAHDRRLLGRGRLDLPAGAPRRPPRRRRPPARSSASSRS